MNPFDPRTVLFAKHAQHVVLIHFPIALLLVGVAFDLLAVWRRKDSFATAAFYNLTVAALSALPVVVTGLLAWQWQLGGARLRGNLKLHLILGLTSSILIYLAWWLHFRSRRNPTGDSPTARIAVELVAVLLIAMTAHIGGVLSGVNTPLSFLR